MASIYPVILCGGSGTRLWPLSRRSMPKQFLSLIGEESLFQQAAKRFSGSDFADPLVITSNDYRFVAAQQLTDIGVTPNSLLLEPIAKNTAPACLVAAEKLYNEDPDAIMLIVPSDHYIPDELAFSNLVQDAKLCATSGSVVTFGIMPDRPETGYGYIEIGQKISEEKWYSVSKFIEKPTKSAAEKMINGRGYFWNSGVFLIRCDIILKLAFQFVPNMLNCVKKSLENCIYDLDFIRLEQKSWSEVVADSLDYAIMEKAKNLVVFSFSGRWSDLGDWQAVRREISADGVADPSDNISIGNANCFNSHSCLVWSQSPEQVVTAIGLKNVIIVSMPDAVLVVDKEQAQSVKQVVELLGEKGFRQAYEQPRQFRPWGWFETVVLAESYQVRRVHLYPHKQMSLQKHHKRSENWIVIRGVAEVRLEDEVVQLVKNESLDIPAGTTHQLANNSSKSLTIIEVRSGEYLGEDDVERILSL